MASTVPTAPNGAPSAEQHGTALSLLPSAAVNLKQLQIAFQQQYGRSGRVARFFRAPGRVNLIGEHTDYNEGFVLPLALDRATITAAARRDDLKIHVTSLELNEQIEFDLDQPAQSPSRGWGAYVEGVARTLIKHGVAVPGADLLIHSTVPLGSGLSSSAALEISTGLALVTLAGVTLEPHLLARIGQQAEHEYVGARVGIMDQLTSVLGRPDSALLLDCRSLEVTYLPLELTSIALLVCDSRVKHELANSQYNQRRADCEQGVALLQACMPNIRSLRDVSVEEFRRYRTHLPPQIAQRCHHVVTENARTLAAAEALRLGQWHTLGHLMNASHTSLRDDYEVSCPELDFLVETAQRLEGVLGARMTGGGFGGCTVNVVQAKVTAAFDEALTHAYQQAYGITPILYQVRAGAGAAEVSHADE